MPGRPRKYPWDDWLDGERHVLRRGEHFDATAKSVQQQAINEAGRREPKVEIETRTTVHEGVEYLLITGKKTPAPKMRRDWDAIFARSSTILTKHRDFACEVTSMQTMAHQAARRRGITIRTDTDQLTVSIYPEKKATEMAPGEDPR